MLRTVAAFAALPCEQLLSPAQRLAAQSVVTAAPTCQDWTLFTTSCECPGATGRNLIRTQSALSGRKPAYELPVALQGILKMNVSPIYVFAARWRVAMPAGARWALNPQLAH